MTLSDAEKRKEEKSDASHCSEAALITQLRAEDQKNEGIEMEMLASR